MKKDRILYISQEITPYLPESNMSHISRHLPQGIQEKGNEIRTFMPRFGCINERRHQLHEVIRLSGMNLIINENDHPLIIKVASIQPARMQVYFIDNEDFFQRKAVLHDEKGKMFNDNDERSVFFCRGVLETVKKLGWAPDVIHCHGWMTSLVPLYLKTAFKNDPLFTNSKVVYSVYNNGFDKPLSKDFVKKSMMDGISAEEISAYTDSTFEGINKAAVQWADGIIIGDETVSEDIINHARSNDKPLLEHQNPEVFVDAYSDFYDQIMAEDGVLAE
ncbi:MAG: glycogen/starch synthase [Vicingaceae bacterium]